MLKRFCAKCGKEISRDEFHQGYICSGCYYEKFPLFNLKEEYVIYICNECNSFSLSESLDKSNWKAFTEVDFVKLIENALKTNILDKITSKKSMDFKIEFDYESFEYSKGNYIICNITGNSSNEDRQKSTECMIKIKRTTCPNCAKIHGKRFEAVIQLRNSNLKKIDLNKIVEDIKKYVNAIHLNNYESFIIEIEKSINGYNIKLSNKSLIKKIKSFMDTRYYSINKISKKLVGKNPTTGGDLYRIYLLIRIIPLEKGDLLEINKKQYTIKRISNKEVYLENTESKNLILKKMKFFEKKNIIVINSNKNRSLNENA